MALKKDDDAKSKAGLIDPYDDQQKDFNEEFDDYLELVVQVSNVSLTRSQSVSLIDLYRPHVRLPVRQRHESVSHPREKD